RFFAKILSKHKNIIGPKNPEKHFDKFDKIWEAIEYNETEKVLELFPTPQNGKIYLTRRSIPHALFPGNAAHSFEFPPLEKFINVAKNKGFTPLLFITVRSPIPNILSWKNKRASGKQSLKITLQQYQNVYPYIFSAVLKTNTQYYILPQESLIVDGNLFIKSIFSLLGLSIYDNFEYPEILNDFNSIYYEELNRMQNKNLNK
ncbi:MAG: hypothetical protein ACOCP8_06565, partial [archaeon]